MIIRAITYDDAQQCIDLGQIIHDISSYKDREYHHEKVRKLINICSAHMVGDTDEFCGFVAEDKGKIVGIMLGYSDEYYFGTDKLCYENAFMVHPDYWGSTAAMRLVKALDRWAEEHNMRECLIGVTSGINSERISKFYTKMGFPLVGYFHKKGY